AQAALEQVPDFMCQARQRAGWPSRNRATHLFSARARAFPRAPRAGTRWLGDGEFVLSLHERSGTDPRAEVGEDTRPQLALIRSQLLQCVLAARALVHVRR